METISREELKGKMDRLLAPGDVDGKSPDNFLRAFLRGMYPPATGRDVDDGLAALVELRADGLARAHAPHDELFKPLAGASLVEKLTLRCRDINRVKLDGRRGGGGVLPAVRGARKNDDAQERVARLAACAVRGVVGRQAAIDEPARPGEREDERDAQRSDEPAMCGA